jgi:uncharacterized protein YuzE
MIAKRILITSHAHFEMKRRRIRTNAIIATIRNPGQVLPSAKGRRIYQSKIGLAGRMLFRVIVKEDVHAYHVITAYKTSKMAKLMKVIYDKKTDTLSILLRKGTISESDEARPGLILDYDKAGQLVSIELLDASEQVKGPETVEFALAQA